VTAIILSTNGDRVIGIIRGHNTFELIEKANISYFISACCIGNKISKLHNNEP
jgi:hypothetical protein